MTAVIPLLPLGGGRTPSGTKIRLFLKPAR